MQVHSNSRMQVAQSIVFPRMLAGTITPTLFLGNEGTVTLGVALFDAQCVMLEIGSAPLEHTYRTD